MYLSFTLDPSEYDASEFSSDHVAVRSDEIWGPQIEVFDRVEQVTYHDGVAITFPDGSTITDPSWESWRVVSSLPGYALAQQERDSGRIRTLTPVSTECMHPFHDTESEQIICDLTRG